MLSILFLRAAGAAAHCAAIKNFLMFFIRKQYYADYAKPDGFCDEAWKAVYQYVFALAHGAGDHVFYYGDWIRKPGVAICSCNDGLRPVIFKLEATETISELDYTPVR